MVFKIGVMNDAELIKQLGGPTRLPKRLGYGIGGAQGVGNWLKRGIPAQVKVDHPDLFMARRPVADVLRMQAAPEPKAA